MFRTHWEIDAQVRDRIERLRQDRLASGGGPAPAGGGRPLARLQRNLGLGLIRVGRRLAGDAAPNLGAPTTTTFGRGVA